MEPVGASDFRRCLDVLIPDTAHVLIRVSERMGEAVVSIFFQNGNQRDCIIATDMML